MNEVHVERYIPLPPGKVFPAYTDHEGWSAWAGVGRVRLVKTGVEHRDGVGAVRAFSSSPGLREEVVAFEPPARMEYRVSAGMPLMTDHHGTVTFSPEGAGTRVAWRVRFRSRIPGLGWLVERGLTVLFAHLLEKLDRHLGG